MFSQWGVISSVPFRRRLSRSVLSRSVQFTGRVVLTELMESPESWLVLAQYNGGTKSGRARILTQAARSLNVNRSLERQPSFFEPNRAGVPTSFHIHWASYDLSFDIESHLRWPVIPVPNLSMAAHVR